MKRRITVMGVFLGDKEGAIGGDGNDDDRDGGLDLEPEDDPGGVDLAVGRVAAADADDADDHGEDAEAEDGAEGEFALEADLDAPEEEDWDCEDFCCNDLCVSGGAKLLCAGIKSD